MAKVFSTLLLLWVQVIHAQLALTNGSFSVKFPTKDWTREKAPAAVSDPITKSGAQFLYFVESPETGAKFIVSRFEYPAGINPVTFVAGFIGGVRGSTSRAGANIEEEFRTFRDTDFPTYAFEADLKENFLHTESVFCADKVYNIQIVGPKNRRDEALKTLKGVTIYDKPMDRASFDKAREPRALARSVAFEAGRRVGFFAGITVVFVGVLLAVIYAVGGFGRKPKPPPLPPSARA
jgi:hypothetical protein